MIFDLGDVRADLRDLLLQKLNAPTPAIAMTQIPQWGGMCKQLCAKDNLGDLRVWIAEGAFYNTWTPAPSVARLEETLAVAKRNDCAAVLVPTVRQSSSSLEDERLVRIPAYVESAIEFGDDIATSLRETISNRRYADFRRLALRTEKECDVRFVKASVAGAGYLDEVARLHGINAKKYGHPIDFYDRPALERLKNGPLEMSLYVALVTRKSDDHALQTMIVIDDPRSESVAFLVQGHEEGDELRRLQLYSYAYWSVYHWAAQNDRKRVFLARGKHEDKARLGANRFWISENWIFSEDKSVLRRAEELARLGAAAVTLPAPKEPHSQPQDPQ